jgi:uncharacterized membrane protein YkgB
LPEIGDVATFPIDSAEPKLFSSTTCHTKRAGGVWRLDCNLAIGLRHVRIYESDGKIQKMNTLEQSAVSHGQPKNKLTELAAWIDDRSIPFLVISIGLIVMLFWAGAYKMTAPGADGIVPLVSNSPLISWHFKLFGPYLGSDLIGFTEWLAAILFVAGYIKPKAGIVGGLVATLMFFTTSTMIITTPGTITVVHGMKYMSFLGLFLFKDVTSLGASLYLISYFGRKAILSENEN